MPGTRDRAVSERELVTLLINVTGPVTFLSPIKYGKDDVLPLSELGYFI